LYTKKKAHQLLNSLSNKKAVLSQGNCTMPV